MTNELRQPERVNEMSSELLAAHALSSVTPYNAPARCTMMTGHFGQRPVISGSEPNALVTGNEEEFGKYTFSVKMPNDGTIIKIIQKYPEGFSENAIAFNPETLVIYRRHDTGQVDCFKVPYHCSHHPTFGFKYEQKPALEQLAVGREFPKDTIFADSPAVKGESHYTFAKNLNIAYMSHPNVGLDGYVINRDALKYFKYRVYETRTVGCGANSFPTNMCGNDEVYKAFPDIGEFIRPDGLLMVTRRFIPELAPALLGKKDLQRFDVLFDNPTYTRAGEGRVVDITVIKSENVNRQLPPEMTKQLEKYWNATSRYYHEILKLEEQLIRESRQAGRNGKIDVSLALHALIVDAKGVVNDCRGRPKQPLTLTHRREPLDGWQVKFTIEYELTPTRGGKLTCLSGGKGVICRIEEPENMPVDADGNVADIITSPDSVPGRMNLGRVYTPYFAGASRDIHRQALEEMGFDRHFPGPMTPEMLQAVPKERLDKAVNTLMRFYSIVSPVTVDEITNHLTQDEWWQWMANEFCGLRPIYIPIEDIEVNDQRRLFFDEMVEKIEEEFELVYGPVSYVGRSGERVETINKVRIAPLPIMLLDKTPDSWLSVDIGKHSNFGIVAAMNQADKYTTPWKKTAPRTISETEGRLYAMYGGREMIAELMDRSGNLASQAEIAHNILHAEHPTAIPEIIDREKIPLGNTRPNQLVHHLFRVAGFDVVYRPEQH